MFDEMVSWYPPLKIAEDGEARNGDVPSNVEQESLLHIGAILRSKYHRKQQRKMFLKSRCCEP